MLAWHCRARRMLAEINIPSKVDCSITVNTFLLLHFYNKISRRGRYRYTSASASTSSASRPTLSSPQRNRQPWSRAPIIAVGETNNTTHWSLYNSFISHNTPVLSSWVPMILLHWLGQHRAWPFYGGITCTD